MAIDCLAGYLFDLKVNGETYPEPSELDKVNPDEEYTDYDKVFVNMVTVDVEEYAKTHFEKSVRKTLTIPSWLNDLAIARNINFSQLLQKAIKEELHLA